MTNKEWLDYLAHNAPDELAAWFDAEHVETEERALDGDTAALNAKIAELQAQVYELQAALDLISISLALPMTSKPITPDMRKPEVLAKLVIETIKKLANEREHYRSKFSRALGYADAIHALMDDEGMA